MLKINEIFGPTIQGEGKSIGREVMFLRLSLCNLHCIWCDTPYTWNWIGTKFEHPDKFDKAKEIHDVSNQDILAKLAELQPDGRLVRSLVISGGEPLIQQKELISLMEGLRFFGWWVEIETNGTINPVKELSSLVNQFNCSPKLENSGNDKHLRERSHVLRALGLNPKFTFKFVISKDEDIEEVLRLVREYGLTQVYLMPEGRTKEELLSREGSVKELCSQHGFTYTPRQHVILWGTKRAV